MDWWHVRNGEQVGPFTELEFRKLTHNGTVTGETLVWHEGLPEWIPFADISGVPQPGESPEPPVAARPATAATSTCAECGHVFASNEMIVYEGVRICAGCKPIFFQRIQEGADAPVVGGMGETPNAELMERARNRLNGNWGLAIGTCLAYWGIAVGIGIASSIVGAAIPLAGNVAQLLLIPPLELGLALFFLPLVRTQPADIGQLFKGFNHYGPSLGVYFFRSLLVGAWSMLAMLPGVIMAIVAATTKNAAMIPVAVILFAPGIVVTILVSYMYMWPMYILADNPRVGVFDAIKRSRLMMRGMKWKLFCLNMRFLGWSLLCMLTFFIGFIWLAPYMAASFAAFYDDVRGRASMPA